MKKADRFFDFYLPDFIDTQLFESSNPTGMDYLLFASINSSWKNFSNLRRKNE